jgi:hypothetical protein
VNCQLNVMEAIPSTLADGRPSGVRCDWMGAVLGAERAGGLGAGAVDDGLSAKYIDLVADVCWAFTALALESVAGTVHEAVEAVARAEN